MVEDWDRDTLLAPIGEHGTGEDLSFSLLIDQIKEARRADPAYLSQGEWQADLKKSDWSEVIALSAQGLAEQSKDLVLAGWLCEGLAHRHDFAGMTYGLELITALCQRYWSALHPTLEEGEEERLARLVWLDDTLAGVVGGIPLLQGQGDGPGYGLARYEESRQIENLARNDADAMGAALAEGKINAEIFQRAVVLTDTESFIQRHGEIVTCLGALDELGRTLTEHLGDQAPPFTQLKSVLRECMRLIERLLGERGISLDPEQEEAKAEAPESAKEALPAGPTVTPAPAASSAAPAALRTVPQSREEAFEMLNGVAQFFKGSEPHSPVPYLVERAVRWGRMPLEEWLRDVIREDSVIDGIRETLGTQRRDEN
ncbi:type VI secretion system protein TssA [Halomonas sp. A29]|uniref:type VI secretion system protein TssA n=1 Tax=Halomonas sp. A29 TaxID=3102786 RepID=UPI00398A73CC